MRPVPSWLPLPLHARLNTLACIVLAGLLLACAIVGASAAFVFHERDQLLAAEAEHGRLYAGALENHLSEVLQGLAGECGQLAREAELAGPVAARIDPLLRAALQRSTRLRSVSILAADGLVLYSSNPLLPGRRIALSALGFDNAPGNVLTPGRSQAVRDLPLPQAGQRPGTSSALPLARALILHGAPVSMLAMVDPGALLPESRDGFSPEGSYAALFDYQGRLLVGHGPSGFVAGARYPALPFLERLRRNLEHGQLRLLQTAPGAAPAPFMLNFRAARHFPVVAVSGVPQAGALERSGALMMAWLGLAAAAVVLLYTALLWRFMRYRSRVEDELRQAKETAEQASAARGAFLSTVSHELRTPMNAVIGMAGLLRETRLDPEQSEFVGAVQDGATTLLAMINDMLDFSRADAGRLQLAPSDCQLAELVEASLEACAAKGRRQGLRLLCHIDPSLPRMVRADPARLRQILVNLIGNAIKFTASGGVTVRARALGARQGRCLVRFEVEDSGIGIDAAARAKLFRPFTQADSSVTRKYGGSGLGLSICKQLVDLMDGAIGVEQPSWGGSLFWCELPLAACEMVAAAPAPPWPARTVLLVEPDPRQAAILADYARHWGMRVSVADSGAAALALQHGGAAPEVALLAATLPDMTSEALRAALAAADPALRLVLLADTDPLPQPAAAPHYAAVLRQPVRLAALRSALAPGPAAGSAPGLPPVAAATPAAQPPRLLLVDDNRLNQQIGLRQLELLGYEADIAADGQLALEALARQSYALVLMDCQMPNMDGFEATRRIRALERGGARHVPIVAMTANVTPGDRERCLAAGMDDYLAKPVDRLALGALMRRYLAPPARQRLGSDREEEKLPLVR